MILTKEEKEDIRINGRDPALYPCTIEERKEYFEVLRYKQQLQIEKNKKMLLWRCNKEGGYYWMSMEDISTASQAQDTLCSAY